MNSTGVICSQFMEGFKEAEKQRFPMLPKETTSSTSMVTFLDERLKTATSNMAAAGNDLETRKLEIEQIQLTGTRPPTNQ